MNKICVNNTIYIKYILRSVEKNLPSVKKVCILCDDSNPPFSFCENVTFLNKKMLCGNEKVFNNTVFLKNCEKYSINKMVNFFVDDYPIDKFLYMLYSQKNHFLKISSNNVFQKDITNALDMLFPNLSKFEMKPKVSLCTIVKNENKYLKEYVEHYLKLGFNKLYLYDNNDIHGETPMDVISEYIENGFVVYHDFRGKKVCQLEAYNDCYKRYSGENDWIAFFDADEFLELTRHDNISSFVAQDIYKDFDGVKINWLCYGDNGQLKYEDKPVQERFTKPIYSLKKINTIMYNINSNAYYKSIIRTHKNAYFKKSVHFANNINYCDSMGITCSLSINFQKPVYNDVFLKHYITKSLEEYIEKVNRGYPDQIVDENKKNILMQKYELINGHYEKSI